MNYVLIYESIQYCLYDKPERSLPVKSGRRRISSWNTKSFVEFHQLVVL